ncbi:MAG TPA: hypothetical protein VNU45_11645, partial [Rummeliibacillus sp.]|nr:hypothetical protein [Rummeliibacillus sp.]
AVGSLWLAFPQVKIAPAITRRRKFFLLLEQKEFSLIPLQQKLHHKILLLKFMHFDFFSALLICDM